MGLKPDASPQDSTPGPPLLFAVALSLTMAVAAMVVPTFGALSRFIVDEFSLSLSQLGWLVASVSIAAAILAPTSGKLSDRHGGRRMILLLLMMGSGVLLGLAAAPNFFFLVVVAILAGAMNSIGNPASNHLIASALPLGNRGLVMGIKQAGIPAGIFLAGLALPRAAQALGWRTALAIASVVPFAVLFVARSLLPSEVASESRANIRATGDDPSPSIGGLSISALVVYSFLMGAGDISIIAFMPLYLQETLGWDVTLAGAAIATAGALGIAARIFWSRWAEHRNQLPAALLLMSVSSFCAALAFWLAEATAILVWIGVALYGAVSLAWNAIVYLLAINTYGGTSPGRSSGFVMFGFMTGSTVGPVAFGYMVDLMGGYEVAWMFILAMFALAGLHITRYLRRSSPLRT